MERMAQEQGHAAQTGAVSILCAAPVRKVTAEPPRKRPLIHSGSHRRETARGHAADPGEAAPPPVSPSAPRPPRAPHAAPRVGGRDGRHHCGVGDTRVTVRTDWALVRSLASLGKLHTNQQEQKTNDKSITSKFTPSVKSITASSQLRGETRPPLCRHCYLFLNSV